ncbi:MAG: hypothetical protein EB100_04960, partial [Crocinitomicaceae bacterium]|nr:hypothetical protein [Crocinitomicaceae bacterium]
MISTQKAGEVKLNITSVRYGQGTSTSPICKLDTAVTIKLTVNDLPIIDVTKDTSICSGSKAFLYVKGGSTYVWDDGFTGVTRNVSPTTKTKYLVVGKDTKGCENKDSLDVSIFSLPNVDVTKDTFVCKGSSISIQASGAATYKWSNGSLLTSQLVTPLSVTKYVVTGTDANKCVNKDSLIIDVKLIPVISGSLTICEQDSTNLTANVASNPLVTTWSIVDGTKASISNTGKLKGIKQGQTLVNFVDKFGCKRDTLITIKPLEKPTLSCGTATGSTVEFTWVATSLTNSYSVSYGDLKVSGKTDTLTALTKYTAKGLALGDSIWLKVKSNGTECYLTDSIVCVAKKCPKPEIDVQPLSKVVCDKDAVEFEVVKTVDTVVVTYQWQTKNGLTWNALTDDANLTGSKTSKLKISNAHGMSGKEFRVVLTETFLGVCSLASTSAELKVNSLPRVIVSNDTSVCVGSSPINLKITGQNGLSPYVFNYSVDGGTNQITKTSIASSAFDTLFSTLASKQFTFNLTSVSYGNGTNVSPVCKSDTIISRNLTVKSYYKAPISVVAQNLFDVTFQWDSTGVGATDFIVLDSVVSLNGTKSMSFTPVQSSAISKNGSVFKYKRSNLSQGDMVYLMVTPIGGKLPRCFESTYANAKSLSCTKPVLNTLPNDTAICSGQTAIFKVNSLNTNLIGGFQWKVSLDNGLSFSNVSDNATILGAKSSSLILNQNLPLSINKKFKVVVTDTSGYCKDSSQIVTLLVRELPTVVFPLEIGEDVVT